MGKFKLRAATCLAERVIFDFAGIPAMLGSDRAQAFVAGVVEVLAQRFGMSQVLGSAFHPEAQGAVERPHRTYKDICKSFMREFNNNWDSLACIFQWTVRTTLKEFNGKCTPYEIITGLKPRLALDTLLATLAVLKPISKERYVEELVKYLRHVHTYVAEQHTKVREDEQRAHLRSPLSGSPKDALQVGDYVLYKAPT